MELQFPFEIDQVMYVPRYHAVRVQVPCPVCCGHRYVWMRNIQGEEFTVHCDGCGTGCAEPRGTVEEYSYEPYAEQVRITGLSRIDSGNKIYVTTDSRHTVMAFDEMYTSEAAALEVSRTIMVELCERNIRSSEGRTAYHRSHATWPVRYHNEQIRSLTDRLEWHKKKLNGRTKVPKSRQVTK